VDEPNSFGNPESRKDLKFSNDQLSTTDLCQRASVSQKRLDLSELAELAANNAGAEFRLEQELEKACIATGATGAAIALARGEKIVCHATTGPDAPDLGVCLDPHNGLSGSCIQTRRLQQCNDTETDSRVDPEASRTLGVRSIVVLPLIEGDKLFGIFEVLSTRPNAFGQRDLDTLQALTDRIVRSRSQSWESTATVAPKASALFASKVDEFVPSPPSKLEGAFPRPAHVSRKTDLIVAALGVLVIVSAVLLGTLVGWRLGWQQATLVLRASPPRYRSSAVPKTGQSARTMSAVDGLSPSSAGTDECGQSLSAGPQTQPPGGGLTVCQGGQVIFRMPATSPAPTRDLRPAQKSLALPADLEQR
jgi:GAF domain